MWAATSVIPVVTDRNSRQGGHLRPVRGGPPPPRHSFHDRTQGRPPKALRKNYFSKVDGDDAAKWCTSIAILPEPAEVIFAQDLKPP